LIPATYGPALFPDPERLSGIVGALSDHVKQRRVFARDAALLLAYIAHQRGDVNGVADAFRSLEAVASERAAPETDLEKILKDIWTGNQGKK
jgi:predicted ATP-grasp superfamily ATP-dependent carboligase